MVLIVHLPQLSSSTVLLRMLQKLDELELDITRVVLCYILLRV